MKSITYIAVLFFLLSSCERETEIKMPPQVPKLVAEGGQSQNALPEVRISRTRGVTDPYPVSGQADPYVVTNVTALLYENDILKDTLKYSAGSQKYKATIATIQPGKTYKLTLSATGFPQAEAISFTPAIVPITNTTYTHNVRSDRDGNMQDELKLTFTDNATTEDYYLVHIKGAYTNYTFCVNTNDRDVEKLVYDDPLYPDDCIQSDRLLLADVNFNGTAKTIIVYVLAGQLDPLTIPNVGRVRATVELLHVNKDHYKYIKSLNSYENATDNPFAEPVNLYSNVKNGYGLFTTYARVVDSIR